MPVSTSAEDVRSMLELDIAKDWGHRDLWDHFNVRRGSPYYYKDLPTWVPQASAKTKYTEADFDLDVSWRSQSLEKRIGVTKALQPMCESDNRLKTVPRLAEHDIIEWKLWQLHKAARRRKQDRHGMRAT